MAVKWISSVLILFTYCVVQIQSQEATIGDEICLSKWDTLGKVAIDIDYQLQINKVKTIKIYFCKKAPITMQLWVHTDVKDELKLVWEYPIQAPPIVPSIQTVDLPEDAQIDVLPAHRMGVAPKIAGLFPMGMNFFPGNQGSVTVSKINYYPNGFNIGRNVSFIELMFPYKFSISMCNDTDNCKLPDISKTSRPLLNETTTSTTALPTTPVGIPGDTGPMGVPGLMGAMGDVGVVGLSGDPGPIGTRGAMGAPGSRGPDGLEGDKGPTGDPGPAGTPGKADDKDFTAQASSSNDDCDCTGLRDPFLVLGMLIWALLLTVLIVVALVIFTRSEHRQDYKR